MPFPKLSKEYTIKGMRIINLFLKFISKYQLAKLLRIHHPHLYRRLNGTHGISEFYYKVLLYMYGLVKNSTGPDGKFSAYIWRQKVNERMNTPAYTELKRRLNIFDDTHEEFVYQTNRKHLLEKHQACQLCGRIDLPIEVHHIITRGEAGGNAMVHTMKNLIVLCKECHHLMHDKKTIRNILVKDRKLYFLKQAHGGTRSKAHATDS